MSSFTQMCSYKGAENAFLHQSKNTLYRPLLILYWNERHIILIYLEDHFIIAHRTAALFANKLYGKLYRSINYYSDV